MSEVEETSADLALHPQAGSWVPPEPAGGFSLEDAANVLGVGASTIRSWCSSGAIAATRVGRTYRLSRSQILDLLVEPPPGVGARARLAIVRHVRALAAGAEPTPDPSTPVTDASDRAREDIERELETMRRELAAAQSEIAKLKEQIVVWRRIARRAEEAADLRSQNLRDLESLI